MCEKEREVSNGFFSWFTSDGEAQNYADAKKHLNSKRLCVNAFQIVQAGYTILDEVDLILHPLKSELNWPIGKKVPLDFREALLVTVFGGSFHTICLIVCFTGVVAQ